MSFQSLNLAYSDAAQLLLDIDEVDAKDRPEYIIVLQNALDAARTQANVEYQADLVEADVQSPAELRAENTVNTFSEFDVNDGVEIVGGKYTGFTGIVRAFRGDPVTAVKVHINDTNKSVWYNQADLDAGKLVLAE